MENQGVFSTSAYSLVGTDFTTSLSGNGNLVNVTDPDLGLLGNNGGPTETIGLGAESPGD